MYFLTKLPDGSHVPNKRAQKLLDTFYPPPKQHGWQSINKQKFLQLWQEKKRQEMSEQHLSRTKVGQK